MSYLSRKPVLVMLAVVVAVAGSLAVWPRIRGWADNWFARRLSQQAAAAPDDQVRRLLESLVVVGDAGLEQLVTGLHSDRPATCNSSRDILVAQLEVWRGWHIDDSAPRAAKLANLLLKHLRPEHRDATWRSAVLANQLLAWPTTTNGTVGTQLIFDCEQVLRAARLVGWPPAVVSDETVSVPQSVVVGDPPVTLGPKGSMVAQPEPSVIDHVTSRDSAPSVAGPLAVAPAPPAVELAPPAAESGPSSASGEPPREMPPSDATWAALSNLEVIRSLARSEQAQTAEEELRRRGFDDKHLRLARLATNADPEARLQLVRVLPQLSGINATAWLLLLARDDVPRVRIAAIQLLSTSKDEGVQRQLRELAEQEEDAVIRTALRDAARGR